MAEKPNIFSHNVLQCINRPFDPSAFTPGGIHQLNPNWQKKDPLVTWVWLQHIGSLIYSSGNAGMAVRLDGWLVVPHAACHMMITV